LELNRGLLDLTLDLPTGSREGQYEVQVLGQPGKTAASIRGSGPSLSIVQVARHATEIGGNLRSNLELHPLG
jgi:hypothetical protein